MWNLCFISYEIYSVFKLIQQVQWLSIRVSCISIDPGYEVDRVLCPMEARQEGPPTQ